jgi:hypothetical protein
MKTLITSIFLVFTTFQLSSQGSTSLFPNKDYGFTRVLGGNSNGIFLLGDSVRFIAPQLYFLKKSNGSLLKLTSRIFNFQSFIVPIGMINDKLIFAMDTSGNRNSSGNLYIGQIWVTDGTLNGTKILSNKLVSKAPIGSFRLKIGEPFSKNGKIYFYMERLGTGIKYLNCLVSTDGTETGTDLLMEDPCPTPTCTQVSDYVPWNFYNLPSGKTLFLPNDQGFFYTFDGTGKIELGTDLSNANFFWSTWGGANNKILVPNLDFVQRKLIFRSFDFATKQESPIPFWSLKTTENYQFNSNIQVGDYFCTKFKTISSNQFANYMFAVSNGTVLGTKVIPNLELADDGNRGDFFFYGINDKVYTIGRDSLESRTLNYLCEIDLKTYSYKKFGLVGDIRQEGPVMTKDETIVFPVVKNENGESGVYVLKKGNNLPTFIKTPTPRSLNAVDNSVYFCGDGFGDSCNKLFQLNLFNTSDNEVIYSDWFTIHPNPAMDEISFMGNQEFLSSVNKLKILTVDGRLIKELKMNGTTSPVSLSELNSGLYIVQLSSESQVVSKKIIKL